MTGSEDSSGRKEFESCGGISVEESKAFDGKKFLKEYGLLTLGTAGIVISDYFFKFPNHFSFGGVTGIAVLLSGVLGGTASTYSFIMNIALLVIGFFVLGKSFGIKSVYVTLLFSVGLEVIQFVIPFEGTLTDQPVLELIFSFIFMTVCSALFFNLNASSGGTDIIALLLKKYTNVSIGRALMITDCIVVIGSFFIYGPTIGLFSLAGFLAKSCFIDTVIESMNLCKYFTIVSTNAEPICEFIHKELNHSATVYHAEGSYTHKDKTVLLTVVNRNQAIRLRDFVRAVDPESFMMITNSSEIIGRGFRVN